MTLYTIKERRGTASEWALANTVLEDGQWGIELGTGKAKLGNGLTPWNSLPYFIDQELISALLASHASKSKLLVLEEGQTVADVPADTLPGTIVLRKKSLTVVCGTTWDNACLLVPGSSNAFDLTKLVETDTDGDPDNRYNHAYWTFTATADQYWMIDSLMTVDGGTDDADTKLSAYRGGSSLADGWENHFIMMNDDWGNSLQSRVDFRVTAGDVIHVLCGSYDPDPSPITQYVLNASVITPDPSTSTLAVPTSVTLVPGGTSPLSGTGIVGGTDASVLSDSSDSSYVQASRYLNDNFSKVIDRMEIMFDTPVGCGGATADDVTVAFRLQLWDDIAALKETVVDITFTSPNYDPEMNESYRASLPNHNLIYDEGIPYDASTQVIIGGDSLHYWQYQGPVTFDTTVDPWPRITTALAAGDLKVTIQKGTNTMAQGQWTNGWVRLYKFTLTVPATELT